MPKLKTNKGAAKRLKKTGSGGIKRRRANRNHILTKKSKSRKRRLRAIKPVDCSDFKEAKILLANY